MLISKTQFGKAIAHQGLALSFILFTAAMEIAICGESREQMKNNPERLQEKEESDEKMMMQGVEEVKLDTWKPLVEK